MKGRTDAEDIMIAIFIAIVGAILILGLLSGFGWI